MNLVTLNCNGIGRDSKREWIRRICYGNKINFIGIQESKCKDVNMSLIQSLWGRQDCDFSFSNSQGKSGGIDGIWDQNIFFKQSTLDGEGFLAYGKMGFG